MTTTSLRKLIIAGVLLMLVALACRSGVRNPGVSEESSARQAESSSIEVVAVDFDFELDANQAAAGTITFVVRNEGSMPHDFALEGEGISEKTSMLDPGESETLVVTLKPGTYEYVCTVPGHAMLGMRGTFTVTE